MRVTTNLPDVPTFRSEAIIRLNALQARLTDGQANQFLEVLSSEEYCLARRNRTHRSNRLRVARQRGSAYFIADDANNAIVLMKNPETLVVHVDGEGPAIIDGTADWLLFIDTEDLRPSLMAEGEDPTRPPAERYIPFFIKVLEGLGVPECRVLCGHSTDDFEA